MVDLSEIKHWQAGRVIVKALVWGCVAAARANQRCWRLVQLPL